MVLVPPFSPLQDSPGFLSLQGILPVSSLLSSKCLLSVRFCVVGRPPPAASGHPSSFRWKSSTLRLTSDQCPLLVSCPASHKAGLHPHPTCAAGGTWLGCGWLGGWAKETVPPTMVWSPSTRRQASPGLARLHRHSSPLFNSFPCTTVCVPILSLLTEEYFSLSTVI